MRDHDAESGAGRLRGVYGDAEKYVEQERVSWEIHKTLEQPQRERRRSRMSPKEDASLLHEVDDFETGDDLTQDGINKLL